MPGFLLRGALTWILSHVWCFFLTDFTLICKSPTNAPPGSYRKQNSPKHQRGPWWHQKCRPLLCHLPALLVVLCFHGHLALLSPQLVPIKDFTGIKKDSTGRHSLSFALNYSLATRSVLSRWALEHRAESTKLNMKVLWLLLRSGPSTLTSSPRSPLSPLFPGGPRSPCHNTDFQTWAWWTSHSSVFLSFHLNSLWAIFSRSSWFPVSARISLKQQQAPELHFKFSIYFSYFVHIKPWLL